MKRTIAAVALVLLMAGCGNDSPRVSDARARFDRCLEAMGGQASMDVLHAVCERR